MKKLILIIVCLLGFFSLSAKEQTIVIKTSGGAERQVLDKNEKPTGATFIGYSSISLNQDDNDNITLNCSDEGWEPCELDPRTIKLKCDYEDLLNIAIGKIKKGENNGKFNDVITKGKKKFTRTVKWTSTGIYKSSKITIILKDA
ncbi:MAG: hypothetical protein WCR42_00220 [bacterium]